MRFAAAGWATLQTAIRERFGLTDIQLAITLGGLKCTSPGGYLNFEASFDGIVRDFDEPPSAVDLLRVSASLCPKVSSSRRPEPQT